MARADMLKDLKRSGLTDADARKADYKPLTAKETKELTGIAAESYLIPYHDAKGDKTEFWRVRYTQVPRKAFSVISKKPPRYSQLINTLPRFYFPRRVNWIEFNKDASEPLAITEGEKKAEKACKSGIPCIAVGGVWAWRSKKKGLASIPDFNLIKWEGRTVWLVFDNDLMVNPLVIGALAGLSNELHKRGAIVLVKFLPKGPGKIGLDDYLIKRDLKAFIKLREDEYEKSAHLWQLNSRIAFIGKVNATWDFRYETMYPTKPALLYQFSDDTYQEPKANGEGFKTIQSADAWTSWAYRRRYDDIGYYPGDEPVIDNRIINTWPGWKCLPEKGNVKPFLDLLDFLFDGEPKLRAWFLQWLAYPLQNPGAKVLTAVLLHSRRQGIGKSFVGYIMGEIYGENFNVIGQDELQSSFNDWVVSKQFILGEEITGNNSRREADRLKNMLTREKLNVNIKYQPGYVMADCANYLFTSNHVDALFLDDYDRRTFVHEIRGAVKSDAFYKRIDTWRENSGPAALFYYLVNDVDLSGFNPKSPAPPSSAKSDMIALSKSDLDLSVIALNENPNDVLRLGETVVDRDLFTVSELGAFLRFPDSRNISVIALSKSLRRSGFRMRIIYTTDGTKRLWAIRNPRKWNKATDSDWTKHYDQHRKKVKFK